jgi:hypothetical protein
MEGAMNTNALRLHLRRFGLLEIALRHPRLFEALMRRHQPVAAA